MKVIVIGGRGFLGSRAVACLERLEGITVSVASRRGPIRVDLADPATFEALLAFDVVVDLADTTTTRPDALAAFCLERGLVFVEASSDREAVERLHLALRAREGPGAVILGGGIFTGLSNLLGAEAMRRDPSARSLDLAIRTSPYSGAGTGTIELMIAAMAQRARYFREGRAELGPSVTRGPRFAFLSGSAPSLTTRPSCRASTRGTPTRSTTSSRMRGSPTCSPCFPTVRGCSTIRSSTSSSP